MSNIESREEQNVPYVVYRDAIADNRWVVRRLVIALIIAIFVVFASNIAWLYVWYQYDYSCEYVETTVDSEGDGIANYTGGDGGVMVGESNGETNEANTN